MDTASYPPPVDKLLTLGDCRSMPMPNYLELGLGPEHIPDLIRMATDEELRWAYSDTLEVWAPIHAFRALGQLHAEAAIEPLLPLFDEAEYDDWVMEELPEVYGMIGPAAIRAITAYVADESHPLWGRITALSSLKEIGTRHPEARDKCVTALIQQLELFDENDPEINGFIILELSELKAVEALPLIKRAFAGDYVEESVMGDWDDVQVEFGLKSRQEVSQQRFISLPGTGVRSSTSEAAASSISSPPTPSYLPPLRRQDGDRKKTKNKMAKLSRKKNRKQK